MLVVEDDLLFSPDFLHYFSTNAPLLDMDTSTFILRYTTLDNTQRQEGQFVVRHTEGGGERTGAFEGSSDAD